MPLHLPTPHESPAARLAAPHQRHRLTLLADGPVGGERGLRAGQVDGVQRSGLLQRCDVPLHVLHRDRA